MSFRSYLPYQTTLKATTENRFVLHIAGIKQIITKKRTSRQEMNEVHSDARLLSDNNFSCFETIDVEQLGGFTAIFGIWY